jgi:capsular polysaccharide biosynthesis protein
MPTLQYLYSTFRDEFKNQGTWLARPFGLHLLTAPQTRQLLAPSRIAFQAAQRLTLTARPFFADGNEGQFEETAVTSAQAHVWRYEPKNQTARLLRSGKVQTDGQVLHTDFGTAAVLKDVLRLGHRERVEADTLLAPWSHYWGSFYDYFFFVIAKLCRMKDALPPDEFAAARVAYPLLHTPFENELLGLLGIGPERLFDSRKTDVRFRQVVLGDSDSWFYPNPADIQALRRYLGTQLADGTLHPRRIYISRAGRRRVLNEDALIARLDRYGFTVVEDRPRSLAEQYALFHNASFIIGPHGAAFTNLLWCQPGTYLLELFAARYMPEYFRYLAELVGIRYAAYCHGPLKDSHHSQVGADLSVDLDELESYLNILLATESSS